MKKNLPLPVEKRLNVIVRLEPGCLGPQGAGIIEGFCRFAQGEVDLIDADFVHWDLSPRYDKSLAEMEYRINGKKLSHDKAAKYLALFGKDLDEFEGHLHHCLALMIDEFRAQGKESVG